ncbi:hypothetical protein TNCT_369311 [Trichonephila clavata]|uniref:Uncharacterized protein n=1 Tax=Trichonephila clavata TaxID=2740835 RepID=A0A8X6ICY0_TRICU|nr:hypothetical protein TNCT_369311 [Trichonephila clavata]
MKERIKSLKYLLNELEKYQVDKVKGCVDDDTRLIELYKLCKFYNEIKNNSLTVLCFYQVNNVTKKIKIEITDSDVTEFTKEHFVSNFFKVNNKTHEQFFLRNLCNSKMILRDLDSIQEDIILLQNCQEFPEITLEDVLIYESEETKKDKKNI